MTEVIELIGAISVPLLISWTCTLRLLSLMFHSLMLWVHYCREEKKRYGEQPVKRRKLI